MIAGLLLAVGCAIAGSVEMLLKQRGTVPAPVVLARYPLRSTIGLFGSKWWTGRRRQRVFIKLRLRRRGDRRAARRVGDLDTPGRGIQP